MASASHHHNPHHPKLYFAPMMASDHMGLGFADKRNRNPNWTDHEIIRFLEILQEEKVLKDLLAQRNKQVFCYVAQRMTAEGSEKTWDQCRIKLKNLKSQYRYVKDRIPNIDEVDLEDDEVLKQLIAECQGRGISPSNIKHLRYLKRFLQKTADFSAGHIKPPVTPVTVDVRPDIMPTNSAFEASSRSIRYDRSPFMASSHDESENLVIDDAESVSPPHTPLSTGIRLIPEKEDPDFNGSNGTGSGPPLPSSSSSNSRKRKRISLMSPMNGGIGNGSVSPDVGCAGSNFGGGGGAPFGDLGELLTGSMVDSYRFIEKFNRDMMDQFMEYQKRVAANQNRWEAERRRQDQMAIEQWRQEAREHDRQMFGIFCSALTHCNAALNVLLRAKQDAVTNTAGLAGKASDSSVFEQSTSNGGNGNGTTSRKTSKGLMTPTDQSSMHSSADDKSPSSKEEGDANCSS